MIRRLFLAAALLLALPAAGLAQDRLCTFDTVGRTTQSAVGGDTIVFIDDPFTVTCNDGVELRANSGRLNRGVRELFLEGDVFFQDSIQSLTSDEATYNSGVGRLYATGNVVFTNREEGSTLEGPELEYFRATDERPLSQVTAGRRPTLTLQPRDGAEGEPLNLVANNVLIVGEDDLTATGNVVITRTDFDASAEEARYDSATEDLELRQNAVIQSEEYDLAGDVVRATMADGALQHVHARTRASLTGEDLRVSAPDLQLFFADELLQRAVATVPPDSVDSRAVAVSRTFRLEADSLDANFLDQQLELVHAVGSARGETIDTLRVQVASVDTGDDDAPAVDEEEPEDASGDTAPTDLLDRDWIMGDTITGFFARASPDPADVDAPSDPDDEEDLPPVELERLVATGSAQSLYRMVPDGADGESTSRRNVNFLVGDRIELELLAGELNVALVEGLKQGVYLEAIPVADVEAPDDPENDPEDDPSAPAPAVTLPTAGDNDA